MTQDILMPQIMETGKAEFYSTNVHVFIPHPSNTGTTLITLLGSYTNEESKQHAKPFPANVFSHPAR